MGAPHLMTRIDGSLETGKSKRSDIKQHSNCWICEGWTQIKFRFDPKEARIPGVDEFTPVYIHLEADEFKADLMERGEDGVYTIMRMVPAGS